jgi:hypothetical protein
VTAPQLPPGHVVAGKYSIVAVLGFGGTSATYRAAGADARAFAVKIFDPGLAQRADVMASLEQVYGASNALSGQDAAPIVDAGYDAQTGAPFSVTELLPNPSLAELVAQRPLAVDEASVVLQSIARVLDGAHARQLLHLALKPTNVFVSPAAGRPVTLTDFGAAYARGAVPSQEGHALAAPWMAPEQLRQGVPIGPAADVFSAGLILFFAITGRSYWRSCAGPSPDFAALAREIVAPRTPPSARAGELGAALSPALDAVLGRALAVDPAERFRSVGELAAAVAASVGGGGARIPDSATTVLDTSTLGGPSDLGSRRAPLPAAGLPAQDEAPGLGSTVAIPEGLGAYGALPAYGQPAPAAGQLGAGAYGGPGVMPGAMPNAAPVQGMPSYADSAPASVLAPAGVPQQRKVLPIILAAGILVLLGGVAVFLLVGRRARHDDGPIAVAAPSARVDAPPASAEPPAPASAEPAATAPSADSAAPVASAAPSTDAEVALSCSPDCDEISIDGKKLDDPSKPVTLSAGSHKVSVAKAGFASQTDTIKVEAGKRFEKQYKLAAKATAPAGPVKVTGPAAKNCGKFLKRCN